MKSILFIPSAFLFFACSHAPESVKNTMPDIVPGPAAQLSLIPSDTTFSGTYTMAMDMEMMKMKVSTLNEVWVDIQIQPYDGDTLLYLTTFKRIVSQQKGIPGTGENGLIFDTEHPDNDPKNEPLKVMKAMINPALNRTVSAKVARSGYVFSIEEGSDSVLTFLRSSALFGTGNAPWQLAFPAEPIAPGESWKTPISNDRMSENLPSMVHTLLKVENRIAYIYSEMEPWNENYSKQEYAEITALTSSGLTEINLKTGLTHQTNQTTTMAMGLKTGIISVGSTANIKATFQMNE
jgi:ABC-type transport system substrate-binding protein